MGDVIEGSIAAVYDSMEVYTKQEVLAFLNHNVYWNLTEIQFEEIWSEYQKSKLKK